MHWPGDKGVWRGSRPQQLPAPDVLLIGNVTRDSDRSCGFPAPIAWAARSPLRRRWPIDWAGGRRSSPMRRPIPISRPCRPARSCTCCPAQPRRPSPTSTHPTVAFSICYTPAPRIVAADIGPDPAHPADCAAWPHRRRDRAQRGRHLCRGDPGGGGAPRMDAALGRQGPRAQQALGACGGDFAPSGCARALAGRHRLRLAAGLHPPSPMCR